jgi:hypothetical protein
LKPVEPAIAILEIFKNLMSFSIARRSGGPVGPLFSLQDEGASQAEWLQIFEIHEEAIARATVNSKKALI